MRALILVDLQNDFMPDGLLGVPDAAAVINVANEMVALFSSRSEPIIATQNWYPASHCSFASNHIGAGPYTRSELDGLTQMLWPTHCVQGTKGAEFVPELSTKGWTNIVQKGKDKMMASYSGFADKDNRVETGLNDILQSHAVNKLFVLGLATDYCVKYTVLDALARGYETILIVDGCRGVNQRHTDSQDAIREMEQAGCQLLASIDVAERG